MGLLKVLKSILEYGSLTSSSQNPIIKPERTDGYVTVIIVFIIGVILILIICIYLLTSRTEKQNGASAARQFPVFISGGDKRSIKCRRKSSNKLRLTKSHKLLEVNRKWSAVYSAENTGGEETDVTWTIPFGQISVPRARKVTFRDSIQDVYYIESKEEVKRLEKLNNMGYDVTIKRLTCSARHPASKITLKTGVCEEKQTVSYPITCSTTADNYICKGKLDSCISLDENCQKGAEFQAKDTKALPNNMNVISNQISSDEEKFQFIPLLTERSV
ncbi:uncharacterized protein LOC111325910 [Stylophora pistillata]|uniref:uncharacterized protein LOC111325910 n=1 Tax=Stylophora pistillata TaxID=50429 RepID=UPI000C056141|nr:uncharacterized protein LOC111325910 [Stylophora pistillata]